MEWAESAGNVRWWFERVIRELGFGCFPRWFAVALVEGDGKAKGSRRAAEQPGTLDLERSRAEAQSLLEVDAFEGKSEAPVTNGRRCKF